LVIDQFAGIIVDDVRANIVEEARVVGNYLEKIKFKNSNFSFELITF
jgi:hypothetical protein